VERTFLGPPTTVSANRRAAPGQFQRAAGRTTIQIRQVVNAQGDGGFLKPRSRPAEESAEQPPGLEFLETGLPAVGAGAESTI
jgi:hypothetical protein